MYCRYCAALIADDSVFCSKCGKPLSDNASQVAAPAAATAWEYTVLENYAPKGQYMDVVVDAVHVSEASARLTFWYKVEAQLMQALRPLLDEGWRPTVEPGPGSLVVQNSSQHSKGVVQNLLSASAVGYNWWLTGYRVELRRPCTPEAAQSTCEIYRRSLGLAGLYKGGEFWAQVPGPDGRFVGESTLFPLKNQAHEKSAHAFLVDRLVEDGWQKSKQGSDWWSTQFQRRPGAAKWAAWETWEVHLYLVKGRDYVFRAFRSSGKREQPFTLYGESETIELSRRRDLLRMEQTPEREEILRRFLAKLESEGFERVDGAPSSNGHWFSRVLIKGRG